MSEVKRPWYGVRRDRRVNDHYCQVHVQCFWPATFGGYQTLSYGLQTIGLNGVDEPQAWAYRATIGMDGVE